MKALIFNSGIGKRMGELTTHRPKSMVPLYNGETIFERQIRLLQEAGINEVIITTGPYPELLKSICAKPCYGNMTFVFPHNEIYDSSNYIYSFFKAKEYLDDDILMMHGDLVFDRSLLTAVIKSKKENLVLINRNKPLPEKDFKGRVVGDEVTEVGVSIFDDNCYALQPLYKLTKRTLGAWLSKVEDFINKGTIGVYAENALNEIAPGLGIRPFSYSAHFIDEVDNPDDLERVSTQIEKWDFKEQAIIKTAHLGKSLKTLLGKIGSKKPFFVVDRFLQRKMSAAFPEAVTFSEFTSNPKYEEMIDGLSFFLQSHCDSIVSIGGGSCIDLAKAIKLSLNADLDSTTPTFRQSYRHNDVRHICVPTTSGTGSESTRHAVLYLNGEKQSICNSAILPDFAVLCPRLILSVPDYQKKCTAMDAFCQCIESLWSRKATKLSRSYALKGIMLFQVAFKGYLENEKEAVAKMQVAANYSGKAINISETTAAHAMSYKITSLFGVPHGHAVAICMNSILHNCKVKTLFRSLDVKELFENALQSFELPTKIPLGDSDLLTLATSVNMTRLSNFPYKIDLLRCYRAIAR